MPAVLGLALDVSGSMQLVLRSDAAEQTSRLQGVLSAVRGLALLYRGKGLAPEVEAALPLVRLFALGIGFADRAAQYGKLGALLGRLSKDAPPVPARVFSGGVRDLFSLAGLEVDALSPGDLDRRWPQIEASLWEQRIDLFGSTCLREALAVAEQRFTAEFNHDRGTPHSALAIVSDGDSKDGSPLAACQRLAQRGTVILCCFLTSEDMAEAKRLYAQPQPGWPPGALALFRCSSPSCGQRGGWRVRGIACSSS